MMEKQYTKNLRLFLSGGHFYFGLRGQRDFGLRGQTKSESGVTLRWILQWEIKVKETFS